MFVHWKQIKHQKYFIVKIIRFKNHLNLIHNLFIKEEIDKEVKVLLEVKAEYKRLTGEDWKPEATGSAPARAEKAPKAEVIE